jgi:excisionase family DNA binding protein
MPADNLIATLEAAQLLGVSVRTVHRMVAQGHLTPAAKVPGRTGAYLFAADDVHAFAATIGRAA